MILTLSNSIIMVKFLILKVLLTYSQWTLPKEISQKKVLLVILELDFLQHTYFQKRSIYQVSLKPRIIL